MEHYQGACMDCRQQHEDHRTDGEDTAAADIGRSDLLDLVQRFDTYYSCRQPVQLVVCVDPPSSVRTLSAIPR